MKNKFIEHFLSIALVSAVLLAILFTMGRGSEKADQKAQAQISDYINLPFVNYDDQFHRALLRDMMDLYHPGRHDRNVEIIEQAERFQRGSATRSLEQSHLKERLNGAKIGQLALMYLKFIVIYILVMTCTWYGVQTIGVWRFVSRKRRVYALESNKPAAIAARLKKVGIIALQGIGSFALFCPAYVIAYSIKTEFATDSLFFMVLLGVVSNGLLIMYSNKFYAFLVAESRRGYVETAVAKNLHNSYERTGADGIALKAVMRPFKQFEGHVFGHIFRNAQFQYISSIKEQASFLITGLIITEMALNIHGHLNYEMLRQILYGNWDIVIAILLGIFYTVKGTEIFVDVMMHREMMRYENVSHS